MKNSTSVSLVIAALCLPLASAADIKPSRLVSPDLYDAQVETLESQFAIGERQFDPFGRVQEPGEKLKPTDTPDGEGKPEPPKAPFAKLVNQFKINAVAPKEGRIMMANRMFHVGDVIPVRYQKVVIQVELLKVTADAVDFRYVKTGEIATYDFNRRGVLLKKKDLRLDVAPDPVIDLK